MLILACVGIVYVNYHAHCLCLAQNITSIITVINQFIVQEIMRNTLFKSPHTVG